MSNLIKGTVKVTRGNMDVLRQAVLRVGGTWLGDCTRNIYNKSVTGKHFQLPGWRYTCCVNDKGDLIYEDIDGDRRSKNPKELLNKVQQDYTVGSFQKSLKLEGFNQQSTKTLPNGDVVMVYENL